MASRNNIIVNMNRVQDNSTKIKRTMNRKGSNDDINHNSMELGEITVDSSGSSMEDFQMRESTLSIHQSNLHRHVMNHKTVSDADYDDAQSSSQSGLWGSGATGYDDDDRSNSNDTGVSPTTTNAGSRQSKENTEDTYSIAKVENLAVMTWRIVMFGVLILTTVGAAVVVYLAVDRGEQYDFEKAFEIDSAKIYQSLGRSMDTKLEAVDALAMMMIDSAKRKNEVWPYTTFPSFASKAAKMRMLTDAIAIQQYVWVEEEERAEWEVFAKANEDWVQEAIEIGRNDTTLKFDRDGILDYDGNYSTSIRYGGPVEPNKPRSI